MCKSVAELFVFSLFKWLFLLKLLVFFLFKFFFPAFFLLFLFYVRFALDLICSIHKFYCIALISENVICSWTDKRKKNTILLEVSRSNVNNVETNWTGKTNTKSQNMRDKKNTKKFHRPTKNINKLSDIKCNNDKNTSNKISSSLN